MKLLFIHCRRGLFQITKCQSCEYSFCCLNCTANLVTYRTSAGIFELLCHQCQTNYPYPKKCPKCGNYKIGSKYSGVEDLAERLEKDYQIKVVRLDKLTESKATNEILNSSDKGNPTAKTAYLSTRVFDPSIEYSIFDYIIFIQAENLLASPDYLVQEDITKSLAEVFEQVQDTNTQIIMDSNCPDNSFFNDILRLNVDNERHQSLKEWHDQFLVSESKVREIFRFPPFTNVLLLTTHEKTDQLAKNKLESVRQYLESVQSDFSEINFSDVYPAKFLKRKNLFSYHLLIKYPRQYTKFSAFRTLIHKLASSNSLQVRLNPRHLF